jgi:hypothetical protein
MTPDERGAIVRAAAHVCLALRSSRPRSGAGRSRAPSTVHESRRCPEHHLTPGNRFEDAVHRTHTPTPGSPRILTRDAGWPRNGSHSDSKSLHRLADLERTPLLEDF